ncbi:hypothetical protein SDC9_199526 [bioreactor metagenome]|uniref:Uncharacterized protein n=1 Tax=bioreactor metagenome TaxID=1076179 RepID=A0A645ILG8_9ZZZZ
MLDALYAGKPALRVHPVQYQAQNVDAPAGGRVVHGVLVDHGLVAEHQRGDRQLVAGQVLPDDRHRQSGGGHVLLRAGENNAVP